MSYYVVVSCRSRNLLTLVDICKHLIPTTAIVSAESKILISPARKLSKTMKPKVLQAARGNSTGLSGPRN